MAGIENRFPYRFPILVIISDICLTILLFVLMSQTVIAQEITDNTITDTASTLIIINKTIDEQPESNSIITIQVVQNNAITSQTLLTDNQGMASYSVSTSNENSLLNIIEEPIMGLSLVSANCEIVNLEPANPTEEQEEAALGNNYSMSIGYFDGQDSVDSIILQTGRTINCTFNNHRYSFCGDGTVQTTNDEGITEECDGNENVLDEHYLCSADCRLEYIPYCGDGIKNDSEECDGLDGLLPNQNCSENCLLEQKQADEVNLEESINEASLVVQFSAEKTSLLPGETGQFNLFITNDGLGEAQKVNLKVVLPSEFSFIEQDKKTQEKNWTWDNLTSKSTISLSYIVIANSTAKQGLYTQTATIAADNLTTPTITEVDTKINQSGIIKISDASTNPQKKNSLSADNQIAQNVLGSVNKTDDITTKVEDATKIPNDTTVNPQQQSDTLDIMNNNTIVPIKYIESAVQTDNTSILIIFSAITAIGLYLIVTKLIK
ncbi:MAG: hypothetical protein PHY34_01365 [Patescibacteria group bacterium]|nr:hypothetical protein [Patescibacteria group bacterium]